MIKIVCRCFQRVIKEGKRLRIIELENYNSAEELLIEKEDTELLRLVRYWDRGPESKGTMATVCMEGIRVIMRM